MLKSPSADHPVLLQVFGSPANSAETDAVPLQLQRSRTRLVFAALVLLRRTSVTRSALSRLIWPDEAPPEGLARLRRALNEITTALRALGAALPLLQSDDGHVRLNPDTVRLDVDQFLDELTAVAQHTHPSAASCAACRERLTTAVKRYRGPLLDSYDGGAGEECELLLNEQRSDLERHYRRALEQLITADVAAGNWPAAAEKAGRLLAVDPYAETAVRVRLEALARDGARTEARHEFERFRRRLRDDLETEPEVATITLLARITAGQLSQPAAPAPTVQLIGRERLINRIEQQIVSGGQRLTSIVGVGGSGKTSLAQVLAQRLAPHVGGNCDTILLAEFSSAAQLWPALLRLSGVDARSSGADPQQTARLLDLVPRLIVLDNAEHLPDLAEHVRLLLRTTEHVMLIVTSLRPLALTDEWVVPLDGLSLPDSDWNGSGPWPAAVELFVRQAGRHLPQTGPHELQRIGRITAAVSGLPLGVILAAAQLGTRRLDDIYQALVVEQQLPTAPLARLDERHHSLARVIDTLWATMNEVERSVLTQAAVFAGVFDLAAAHAVIRLPSAHADDLRDLLYAAVDRALLRVRSGQRFAWHALLHRDARRRLSQHADAREIAARHADYQLQSLAAYAAPGGQRAVSPPDLREAWLWLCAQGDPTVVRSQATLVGNQLFNLTHYALAAELLEAAAAALSCSDPLDAQRMRAEAALMLHYAADYERAWQLAEQIAADAAVHHDPIVANQLGTLQVMRAFHDGRLREAEQIADQLELRLAAQLPVDEINRLLNLRLQASYMRDNHLSVLQIGEQLSQMVGYDHPTERYFGPIVAVSRLMSDNDCLAAARELLSTLRRDLRIDGRPHWIVSALEYLLAGEAVRPETEPLSDPERPVSVNESGSALVLAIIQRRCAALPAARSSLEQALATSRMLRSSWGRGAILTHYSQTVRQLGDESRAVDAGRLAVELCELHCDRRLIAAAYCALGYALLTTAHQDAAPVLNRAAELAHQLELTSLARDVALARAVISWQLGRPDEVRLLLDGITWTAADWWHSDIAAEAAWLLISLLELVDRPRAEVVRRDWLAELTRIAERLSPAQRADWLGLNAHAALHRHLPHPFTVPADAAAQTP